MNHPALSEPASTTFATRSASTFVAAPFGRINAAPYFRREFTVGEGLVRATLSVTALGIVEPYLNGRRVGSEMLTPGWTSYRHRLIVTTIDVTDDVRPGQNAVGAIVGDGWAIGRLGWNGNATFTPTNQRCSLSWS